MTREFTFTLLFCRKGNTLEQYFERVMHKKVPKDDIDRNSIAKWDLLYAFMKGYEPQEKA